MRHTISLALGFSLLFLTSGLGNAEERIDFQRDIQPLFQAHCLKCHGPEKRRGGLLLTNQADALLLGESGKRVIVPGHADQSELVRRLLSKDRSEHMPPTRDGLTPEEILLVQHWIDQGAHWPASENRVRHWAYVKPQMPALPAVKNAAWVRNPIDVFILARLEKERLAPSPEVDRARLLRRVYLDLIGLPPTPEEVDAFLADRSADAYEKVVDHLLASPHYGERWARAWLDLARYADSNGFQRDGFRTVWPYRDWVIAALNADMPFDRFTIEQIAGDLLPEATPCQKIATGFHRCTTVNVEAGVDREEDRVNAIIDRVNVTGTVWLGVTMACARCHNHKYDPFTQKDYYQLFAFFNNTPIETAGGAGSNREFTGPRMTLPLDQEKAERTRELQARKKALTEQLRRLTKNAAGGQTEWEQHVLADAQARKTLPTVVRRALAVPAGKRNNKHKQTLRDHYLRTLPGVRAVQVKLEAVEDSLNKLTPPTTLVMTEMDRPRVTHIFKRGNFLTPGPRVTPGVPDFLHPMPAGLPANRLGLARWLASPENPLVARVTVNRWWAGFFGKGLVTTPEDFGTQGARPTHPGLLDWLACWFIEQGWSPKAVHRLIVTSATYRQSPQLTPELLKRDPENRLYARGPRFRLDAEGIRDNALAISGLLSHKMAGPPVFPPQPAKVWNVIGRVDNTYRTSTGEDRYRRGLYTIWRRSSPYPSFVAFDAPDRSSCVVQRSRTNTPLQALTLLNDEVYVEMARSLARRIQERGQRSEMSEPEALATEIANSGQTSAVRDRIIYAFRLCLAREPRSIEVEILERLYQQSLARYRADPAAALAVLGMKTRPAGVDVVPLAAWFQVSSALLNLDETITKG